MKTLEKKLLKDLEMAIQDLTDVFVKKHFGDDADYYWIADDIGGVLQVNDYFFNLEHIMDFTRYSYTSKQLFEYYDYTLNGDEFHTNIKNWRKLKK